MGAIIPTWQPAEAAAVDTYLESVAPTADYSVAATIKCGVADDGLGGANPLRSLLKFDISSVPAGSNILTCELVLVTSTAAAAASACVAARITQTAMTELANWNTYDGTNVWTLAGGDFTATDQASFNLPLAGDVVTISLLEPLAQDALDTRSGILLLLLKRTSEALPVSFAAFHSASAAGSGNRPMLRLAYWTSPRRSYPGPNFLRRTRNGVRRRIVRASA